MVDSSIFKGILWAKLIHCITKKSKNSNRRKPNPKGSVAIFPECYFIISWFHELWVNERWLSRYKFMGTILHVRVYSISWHWVAPLINTELIYFVTLLNKAEKQNARLRPGAKRPDFRMKNEWNRISVGKIKPRRWGQWVWQSLQTWQSRTHKWGGEPWAQTKINFVPDTLDWETDSQTELATFSFAKQLPFNDFFFFNT